MNDIIRNGLFQWPAPAALTLAAALAVMILWNAASAPEASAQSPSDDHGDHGDPFSSATRISFTMPSHMRDHLSVSMSDEEIAAMESTHNFSTTVSGVIGTANDEDYFSLQAESRWVYTFETTSAASGSDVDTYITLYDASGSILDGDASKIKLDAPSSATYYVKVEGRDGSTGGYMLRATRSPTFAETVSTVVSTVMANLSWSSIWDELLFALLVAAAVIVAIKRRMSR